MAKQPYESNLSVFQSKGIDLQPFATYFDGGYCQTYKNIKKLEKDFCLSFCVRNMDFSGGANGILQIKGEESLNIQFNASDLIQVDNYLFYLPLQVSDEWVNILIQRKDGKIQLWINGQFIEEVENTKAFGGGNINIGVTNIDRYLRAELYDFRLYMDKSLSENDIIYLYTDYLKYEGNRTMPRVKYGTANRPSE